MTITYVRCNITISMRHKHMSNIEINVTCCDDIMCIYCYKLPQYYLAVSYEQYAKYWITLIVCKYNDKYCIRILRNLSIFLYEAFCTQAISTLMIQCSSITTATTRQFKNKSLIISCAQYTCCFPWKWMHSTFVHSFVSYFVFFTAYRIR